MRALFTIVALVLVAITGPAWSQASAPSAAAALSAAAAAKTTAAPPPAAAPAITAADLQNLVATLQNDKDRALLVKQLQALIAAGKAAAPVSTPTPTPAPAPAPAPSAVEIETQGIVENLTTHFQNIGTELVDIVGIASSAPAALDWIAAQAVSPHARWRWFAASWRLGVVFAAGLLAAFLLARLLRPVWARLGRRRDEGLPRWLALFVTSLILKLLPIAVFAAVATLLLAILHPTVPARPMAAVTIVAILRAQALLAAAWVFLLSPAHPYFLRLGEESRTYLYIWARRFVLWAVYGFAVAHLAAILRAPGAIDDLILRVATIVLAGLSIVFVLQNQPAVTAFLRDGPGARRGGAGMVPMFRGALADTWHILAIVYILGSFGSYLVDLHGGVGFVLRATAVSIAVLIGAGLATRFIHRLNRRGFELTADMRGRFPTLQSRANRYLPALIFVISALVYLLAVALLLQAWGTDVAGWFQLQSVRQLLGSLASIAIVVFIAIAIWELISAGVERALGADDTRSHAQVGARLRTLLPLVRSTVLIAIVTMAGIIVLSQLGVDIAPLLAGAGIIGIAVGLGSQQLVRDIINGLFILIENTVTVGEMVDVGGGHAGVVEEISIRSMRLRDGTGAVHTIPFSSVTAITNTNRGIGNAAVSVSVALGEDTDRAARLLAQIATAMRQDPAFKFLMLSELQYWGIDKVDGSAVTLVGQIVCTDAGRWPVQREFNRRVMQCFQAEGIAYALPAQAVVVREPERTPGTRPGDPPQVTPLRAPRERG